MKYYLPKLAPLEQLLRILSQYVHFAVCHSTVKASLYTCNVQMGHVLNTHSKLLLLTSWKSWSALTYVTVNCPGLLFPEILGSAMPLFPKHSSGEVID